MAGTRQIPPGKEGNITIDVSTAGYGGRKLRQRVRVMTNDPVRPWQELVVTGQVEKFAEIRPERVSLSGPSGRPLSSEVEIIPRKDHPFSILKVKARSGEFIKYETNEKTVDGQNRYVIRVENKRQEAGRYVDTLLLQTDSTVRPTIPIHVFVVLE